MRNRTICARLAMPDVLVTVCEYNLSELVTRCGSMPSDRIAVIYCGVDARDFQLAESSDHGTIRLLSVGRLVPQKGFDDLIRAVGILTNRGLDVRCDIVGGGRLRHDLETLILDLGLAERVRLIGPLGPPEVARAMFSSDIFVLACKIDEHGDRDSMPVVIKEAMASGLPVVGTAEVAIPEMIDAEVGRLARPGDPASLAAALDEVIELGPAGRRALGQAGRKRVEDRFDLTTETRKLGAIFSRLSGEDPPPGAASGRGP
jgi:glycosyltransferase involved in cell wall biosynthesis